MLGERVALESDAFVAAETKTMPQSENPIDGSFVLPSRYNHSRE